MNKQEAIEKIEELKKYFCGALGDDWINLGIDKALNVVKQLDEPEKPVVPQFVADWYEAHAGADFEYSLYRFFIDFHEGNLDDNDLQAWFTDNSNKPIQTIVNMHQFDYEVEKEKLYTAQLKSTGEYLHYDTETDKVHHFCAYGDTAKNSKHYHFTKDTLLKYNAWENDSYDVNEVKE